MHVHARWKRWFLLSAVLLAATLFGPRLVLFANADLIFKDGFENSPPVITSSPVTSATVGEPYAYDVNATDADGDSLNYALTVSPANMTINPSSGLIAWTPATPGEVNVTVEVTDGRGGLATQSWSITVGDDGGPDSDSDGLSDSREALYGTDPNDPDSDDDGLLDGAEVFTHKTDPLHQDSDRDGLNDGQEVNATLTLPKKADTDGDGFGDGTEVQFGTDPLDPADFPTGTPEPQALASLHNPSTHTTLLDSVAFIFAGNPPIQTGVAPGTIDAVRVAVLQGRVLDRDGNPLPATQITIGGHPELGQTQSRVDGRFDLVVNGGGPLTIDYQATGFLPAQRTVNVPWLNWVQAPDVVLIPVDAVVTSVDLMAPGMKSAAGSPATDDDGTRTARVLFPEGVGATLVMPDGSSQPLMDLDVRATEYTIGDMGPKTMPAMLPPSSGYTYAVELSVDEALATGGQIEFSAPLPTYVENFLDFPVGGAVPSGYYDSDRMTWVPSPDGRVIKILATGGGTADIDINGDDVADDPGALAALGITLAERQHLAATYTAGQELWRVPVTHFTPYDYNWPFGPPSDAISPQTRVDIEYQDYGDLQCGVSSGSIVACQSQVLGERVVVTGTPFTLNYRSNRVPGNRRGASARITVSQGMIPPTLEHIEVSYGIAGQLQEAFFAAAPDLSFIFDWDGSDGYGRNIYGSARLAGEVRYYYQAVSAQPADLSASFGSPGQSELQQNPTRQEVAIVTPFDPRLALSLPDARAQGLGGWTLDAHHAYDPIAQKLLLGSGETREISAFGAVMERVVPRNPGAQYEKAQARALVAGPDGSLYFQGDASRAYRRAPDGSYTRMAGCFGPDNGPCVVYENVVEGTPALEAELAFDHLNVDSQGALYLAHRCSIIKVDEAGLIKLVAGELLRNNCYPGDGDGGPAIGAALGDLRAFALGPDGSIYFTQDNPNTVRRISPDGTISHFAGAGIGYSGDGGPATEALSSGLEHIAVGPDGTVYLSDYSNFRIRAVTPDGIIDTIAGTGIQGSSGDGGPADEAQIQGVASLSVSADGKLVFLERDASTCPHLVRTVDSAGIINTIAGSGDCDFLQSIYAESGLLARNYGLVEADRLAFGPSGEVFLLWLPEIWRIASPLPLFGFANTSLPSEDGIELYVFDYTGRHLETRHTLTGAVLYSFDYDPDGRLISVTDGDGKVTTIQRDGAGNPTGIVSPFGQQTALAVDANGFLQSITTPAGEQLTMVSTSSGLVTRFSDPRGRISNYSYDSIGRLVSQADNAGYSQTLVRTGIPFQFEVTRTSGMGRSTSYQVVHDPNILETQTMTGPDGSILGVDRRFDLGSQTAVDSDGAETTLQFGANPRFGMLAPVIENYSLAVPGGPTLTASANRSATVTDPSDPLSLVSLSTNLTIDGRSGTMEYTAASKTRVLTSPEGRITTVVTDELGRVITMQYADLAPVSVTYNGLGQRETFSVGSGPGARVSGYAYGPDGFLESITDPIGRIVGFARDAAGRMTSKTYPGGAVGLFSYNAAGDLVGITPPGQPEHQFTHNLHGQILSWTPPSVQGSGPTTYAYNDDRQLTSVTLPGDEAVSLGYDAAGRIQSVALTEDGLPAATYTNSYFTGTQLDSITGPDAQTVSFDYQGNLLTGKSWGGVVVGDIEWTYDSGFRIISETVNGGASIAFSYDDDDKLVGAGDLDLTRNPVNAQLQSADLGVVHDDWTYNSFGEVTAYTASANAVPVYSVSFTRDDLGRITQKVETIGGVTGTYDYDYDPRGQLIETQLNNVVIESYSYDSNGNRLSGTVNSLTSIGSYDDQDRLISYGDHDYTYTPAGRLLTRTAPGSMVTAYDHDALGNLRGATLPDATVVAYDLDGLDRRVRRSIDGAITHQFLYSGILVVAQMDDLGNATSRFVYAGSSTPAYMIRNATRYRLVTDQTGSVRLVVNVETGAIVQRLDYDSFGNVMNDTNPGFQPFGFAGGLYDPATGLTRFGSRDYDPKAGRWTTRDPIYFAGGDSNLFRYAYNDPINLRDSDGLEAESAGAWADDWDLATEILKDLFGPAGKKLKELSDWYDKIKKPIDKFNDAVDFAEDLAEDALHLQDTLNDPSLNSGEQGLEFFDCLKDYLPKIPGWGDNPFGTNPIDDILDFFRDLNDELKAKVRPGNCGGYGVMNC